MTDIQELRKLCLDPIAGDAPYGYDPRGTDEFRIVKSIVARYGDFRTKATEGDPDEPKQWTLAIENCITVLQKQGKDMRVLCWLCGALVSIHGIRGLKMGLEIVRHFLEDDPNSLYPTDIRAKANPFSWLTEFIDFALANYSKYISNNLNALAGDESQALVNLYQEFERFYAAANESLTDDRFDFKPLRSAREKLQSIIKLSESRMSVIDEDETPPPPPQMAPGDRLPEDKPKVEAMVPPEPKVPVVTSSDRPERQEHAPVQENSVGKLEEAKLDKNALLRDLAALAFKLRSVAAHDPLAFKLLRLAKWNPVTTQLPTLPKTKRTRIPGPRTEFTILKTRENRLEKRESFDHGAFLETCESWFNKYPFWLDLQYLAYTSAVLAGLEDIALVIADETRTLIDRLGAEFMELEFKEGAPFADEATRQWLRTLIAQNVTPTPPLAPERSVQPVPPSSPPITLSADKLSAPLDGFIQARFEELSSGKAAECLTTTTTKLAAENSPLACWRLLRVCGLAAAALPQRKLLAIAILRECFSLAETLTIKQLHPVESGEILLVLRDLGADDATSAQERDWIVMTGNALHVAPASVILRELSRH